MIRVDNSTSLDTKLVALQGLSQLGSSCLELPIFQWFLGWGWGQSEAFCPTVRKRFRGRGGGA